MRAAFVIVRDNRGPFTPGKLFNLITSGKRLIGVGAYSHIMLFQEYLQ